MTETLDTADGHSVLTMERRLKHPPEKVWRAITEPERLADWFPSTMTPELRPGGTVDFGSEGSGTVTDLDPPRLFAYTWGDHHLRWELHPDDQGTRLVLVATFDDRAGAASFASGWHICIAAMDLALDGRPGVDPGYDHVALHEQFIAQFGLDAGTTETTADGWQVRYERQLTRPADEVWALLSSQAPPDAVRNGQVLEHDAEPGGRVRWELVEGTGHGARVVLTHTGSEGEPASALSAVNARMKQLVADLSEAREPASS
ncbi:SRPBCC family protein [Pseudonocardia alaniniphila]|uniref:SRPBCC family protein n=1 Tax=Pseudonocardia alaniniphila TaxID=75291 RepID=A0ABS9TKJ3_9PSEU|nr:SRPBCC family protein [Pseudonocardia alaniniphila]MCH6169023.1 SRPBCC family protein [Pseudonocardia alaniniphila]